MGRDNTQDRDNPADNASDIAEWKAIRDTISGDIESFSYLVRRYQPLLHRLARNYLRNEDAARDAVQEIFLKAFESLSRFDTSRRFLPWLYSIAVNHLKSEYRKNRRRTEHEFHTEYPIEDLRGNPEALLIRSARDTALRNAIETLPNSLREVVILYYMESLSVDDVGAVLHLGRENVKSKLHRARKKLRVILEPDATE